MSSRRIDAHAQCGGKVWGTAIADIIPHAHHLPVSANSHPCGSHPRAFATFGTGTRTNQQTIMYVPTSHHCVSGSRVAFGVCRSHICEDLSAIEPLVYQSLTAPTQHCRGWNADYDDQLVLTTVWLVPLKNSSTRFEAA